LDSAQHKDVARQKLGAILQEFFADPGIAASDSLTAADVPGWDSLAHIELVVLVEKAFALRFRAAEIQRLENVGAMLELIVKKGWAP
jgi:acyl carrier protein